MSIPNCPSCNSPVPPGSVFCDNCGYDLRDLAPAGDSSLAPTSLVQQPETGGLVCPTCGHPNVAGSAFCEDCGSQLALSIPSAPAPAPAPAPTPAYSPPPAPAPQPVPAPQPAPVAAPKPISSILGRLVIQASNASLPIPQGKQTVVIGREDPVSGIFPDIDLDPYGAQDEGVGRKHAQLVLKDGEVCLEDLDSVNGTMLNRQRLAAHQPQPIKDGDELRFGKMVLIYRAS